MNKRILATCVLLSTLTLVGFQNCSSSLPTNATSNSSSTSAASNLLQCTMDNNSYPSGTVQTGYIQSVANGGSCPAAQTLTCTNGFWYGTSISTTTGIATGGDGEGSQVAYPAAYANCVAQNQACTAAGGTLASGATELAYTATSVPYNSSCSSIQATLSCNNGVVTSSTSSAVSNYVSTTCSVAVYSGTYNYVGEITTGAYQDPSVYGVPGCPNNSGGQACSSPGSQCFVNYYNYGSTNYYHHYSCQ